MKIALIHGIGHQGSTWHYADLICQEFDKLGSVEKTEFYLPRDMPHFCTGCYNCFYQGEESCPCERRAIIDLNRRQKLTHPESRAIIRVEEAFMKGARHDKEWDDTNDT